MMLWALGLDNWQFPISGVLISTFPVLAQLCENPRARLPGFFLFAYLASKWKFADRENENWPPPKNDI